MKIPVSYSFRNLWTRRLTTVFTASGMALVVFVFASILMLSEGLKKTLVETGSYNNVVVIRKAAVSEVQSGIDRIPASIVETQPEIATGPDGQRLARKRAGRPDQSAKAREHEAWTGGHQGDHPKLIHPEAAGQTRKRTAAQTRLIRAYGRDEHREKVSEGGDR